MFSVTALLEDPLASITRQGKLGASTNTVADADGITCALGTLAHFGPKKLDALQVIFSLLRAYRCGKKCFLEVATHPTYPEAIPTNAPDSLPPNQAKKRSRIRVFNV